MNLIMQCGMPRKTVLLRVVSHVLEFNFYEIWYRIRISQIKYFFHLELMML